MPSVDLASYYSGGYFLIRASDPSWEQLKRDPLPETFISLSRCICSQFELMWGWETGYHRKALEFGIPAEQLDHFISWCQHEYETEADTWGMFYSTVAARRFIQRFISDTHCLHVIGIGFPAALEAALCHEADSGDDHTYGVKKRIQQHLPLETGGEVLGHEIVSFTYGNFGHSWLCNGIHEDMDRLFGIHLNPFALIDSYDEAKKVYDWIAEDHMQGTRAEPEPYYPWLLISYPLTVVE